MTPRGGAVRLTDDALERVEAIAAADATARTLQVAFDAPPADQRAAIEARTFVCDNVHAYVAS